MLRVRDLDAATRFFCDGLRLTERRRKDYPAGCFSLVFLSTGESEPELKLTHNSDQTEPYTVGRRFGHVANEVGDIHVACQRLVDHGYVVNRPPRDGRMAFIRSPDVVSVELLQRGEPLPPAEPWVSRPNVGEW
jgi:lactoylglutathione lyase